MNFKSSFVRFLVRILVMSGRSLPRFLWMSVTIIVLINLAVIYRILPTDSSMTEIDVDQKRNARASEDDMKWFSNLTFEFPKSGDKTDLKELHGTEWKQLKIRDRNRSSVFALGDNGPLQESFTPEAEVRHIYFLKVHKSASSTMLNIILRFAIHRNLSVMLPRRGNQIRRFRNPDILLLPSFHANGMYDVMCNHAVYDRQVMATFFPKDTVYVGIVRQPFAQFVSAFVYYRDKYKMKYLRRIKGDNPIRTYLNNPSKYETKVAGFSYTNNRMAYDFGYPPSEFQNISKFKEYLMQLDNELHFVLVVEYFIESLILLKRFLHWSFQDIIYVIRNVRSNTTMDLNLTESDKQLHKRWAILDYALYEHFKTVLLQKISKTGPDFREEVEHFKRLLERVRIFCERFTNIGQLFIEASPFNRPFFVTKANCDEFHMRSFDSIKLARQKQTKRLDQLGIKYCALDKKVSECRNTTELLITKE